MIDKQIQTVNIVTPISEPQGQVSTWVDPSPFWPPSPPPENTNLVILPDPNEPIYSNDW